MKPGALTLLANQWIGAFVVFVLAILLFSINLDRPPHPDELYHALAARDLLETGRPILAEGEYWRGYIHTWMVAVSYAVFGEGLASARLPAVVLMAGVAVVLFLWVGRQAGPVAGWLTAAIFVTSPFTVEIAQFSRFYGLQTFAFVCATVCVFYALDRGLRIGLRLLLAASAIGLLLLATSVQVTTLVGILGIAVWCSFIFARYLWLDSPLTRTSRLAISGAIVVAASLALWVAVEAGFLEFALDRFQETPLHAAARADEVWFYHLRFLLFYPTLWTLIGVLAILAVLRSPRIAWLAVAVFLVAFLLMSFAAWKATRYLSFAIPFVAIVWGIGLAEAASLMRRNAGNIREKLQETLALPARISSKSATLAIGIALLVVVLGNPFWLRTAAVIGNVALPGEEPATDWRLARDALAPWVVDAGIMITTEELGSMYFLGRSDVRFSPSKFNEIPRNQRFEFGLDHRTGRPIITKPESIELLIRCFSSGFIVGPRKHWGDPLAINSKIQAIIERHAKPIAVPPRSYLYAWGWRRAGGMAVEAECRPLEHFSGRRGAPAESAR